MILGWGGPNRRCNRLHRWSVHLIWPTGYPMSLTPFSSRFGGLARDQPIKEQFTKKGRQLNPFSLPCLPRAPKIKRGFKICPKREKKKLCPMSAREKQANALILFLEEMMPKCPHTNVSMPTYNILIYDRPRGHLSSNASLSLCWSMILLRKAFFSTMIYTGQH